MITIDVTPAKKRFGRKPRKQWQYSITAGNNEPLDPRDTYANAGDVVDQMVKLFASDEPVRLRVHYADGVEDTLLRGEL